MAKELTPEEVMAWLKARGAKLAPESEKDLADAANKRLSKEAKAQFDKHGAKDTDSGKWTARVFTLAADWEKDMTPETKAVGQGLRVKRTVHIETPSGNFTLSLDGGPVSRITPPATPEA